MGIASHAIQRYAGDVGPCRVVFHQHDTRAVREQKTARSSAPHALHERGLQSTDATLRPDAEKKEAAGDVTSPTASVRVLWRCPTLPQPVGCSTIGAAGLSFQVRNGGWAFPRCYDHHKIGVQHVSPLWLVGVWVDRGLYSGCGCFACLFCCSPVGWVLFSVGPLVPVGSRAPRGASTSGLSTRSSGGGLSPTGGVEISS